MARLIVEAGKNIGEEYALSGEAKLGRDPACTFRIDDNDVSREHALLRALASGTFRIVDLGSKNGTWVNEERVKEETLRDGDRVRVGNTVLLFRADTGARGDSHGDLGDPDSRGDSGDPDLRDSAGPGESAGARDSREDAALAGRTSGRGAKKIAAAPARPFDRKDAIEAGLFVVVLVLAFFIASYAARIFLSLAR